MIFPYPAGCSGRPSLCITDVSVQQQQQQPWRNSLTPFRHIHYNFQYNQTAFAGVFTSRPKRDSLNNESQSLQSVLLLSL